MKFKIATILMLFLLIPMMAPAANQTVTVTFAWQQAIADLPSLAKWPLYWGDTPSGSSGVKALEIPFVGGTGPDFQYEGSLTITGNPGQQITKYFYLTAVSKSGKESGPSNVVSQVFTMPWGDMTTPQSLTVKVVISTP